MKKKGLHGDPSNLFESSELYHYLGYWSLIGLCRMHVILGDYYLALKTLDPIPIHNKAKHISIVPAYISLHYYLGFSYLMMRRYHDAIDVFSSILLRLGRVKKIQMSSYDQTKFDNMYALLALLTTLYPTQIDEHVHNTLNSEHADKITAARDAENVFSYSCPKFVSPSFEPEESSNNSNAPLPLQRKIFMKEMAQQSVLPTILSYLKLYDSLHLDKLMSLLQKKVDKESLRSQLTCVVHKSLQLRGSHDLNLSEGTWQSSNNPQFWMEGDLIQIHDNTIQKNYADFFLGNCNTLINVTDEAKKQNL